MLKSTNTRNKQKTQPQQQQHKTSKRQFTTKKRQKTTQRQTSLLPSPQHQQQLFSLSPSLTTSLSALPTTTILLPSKRHFQSKARRDVPAGQPKGLPPKVVLTKITLTAADIQAEEERQKYVVKEFYKTKAKWTIHPKLDKCNDIVALESYLWDHQQRLRWFRGRIADESNRSVKRSFFRTHISIHKKNVKYIEDKIHQLKGTLAIPKLYDPLAPHYHDKINPFMNQVTIVERPLRDYDYPMKETFEPIAQQGKIWQGSSAERVQAI